jgi:hypothetical protein
LVVVGVDNALSTGSASLVFVTRFVSDISDAVVTFGVS